MTLHDGLNLMSDWLAFIQREINDSAVREVQMLPDPSETQRWEDDGGR